MLEHLADRLHRNDLQRLADLLRDLRQVLLVLLRNQHYACTRGVRRQRFALQATDRQHTAAKGDLAGHRHLFANWDAGERRHDRRRHRHARRRAILRNGTRWHVNVETRLLEALWRDAELRSVRLDPGEGGSRRLLHHIAELAGEDQLLAAIHDADFDGDNITADRRHDETGR